MRELALFAGAGGGILASHLLGWRTVCAVEIEPYPASVLVARQNDKALPPFPIWSNICTFDGRPWRGLVDIISGGFPCQDISAAGQGAGINGSRSKLWFEMLRVINEVQPRFVFVENSPMLRRRGLGAVLSGLSEAGYNATWTVLGADDLGAPHIRKRLWLLAENTRWQDLLPHAEHARDGRGQQREEGSSQAAEGGVADTHGHGREALRLQAGEPRQTLGQEASGQPCGADSSPLGAANIDAGACPWWRTEPRVGRVAYGVAHKVERIKCLGNGQVPIVAAAVFALLYGRLCGERFDISRGAC